MTAAKQQRAHDPASLDLAAIYLQLEDGPSAIPHQGGAAFWRSIDQRTDLQAGRLVCIFAMTGDWPHWEMHPEGDEVVCLLSGAMDLVLDEPGGERTVALRGRDACVVPRGVWHRGLVREPGEALFITRRKGTRHRPV